MRVSVYLAGVTTHSEGDHVTPTSTDPSPRPPARRLVTAADVAELLFGSRARVNRVYTLAREGILPDGVVVVRLGRSVRFNPDGLDRFLAAGGRAHAGGWRREPST